MLALAALLFTDLHLLKEERDPVFPGSARPAASFPVVDPAVVVVTAARITLALGEINEPYVLPEPTEEPMGKAGLEWVHRSYHLQVPRPRDLEQMIAPFLSATKAIPEATVAVQENKDSVELQYGVVGLRTHTIRFSWLARPPRMSVILARLGDDLLLSRELLALNPRPSFAVQPFDAFSDVVAERLALDGAEVLLDWKLLPQATPQENEERPSAAAALASAFQRIPRSAGLLLDSHPDHTSPAPDAAFFAAVRNHVSWVVLSSAPLAKEVCAEARKVRLACTGADDDLLVSPEAMPERVAAAIELARSAGDRILVLPARSDTLETLRAAWGHLRESGIELVPVSALLLPQASATGHPPSGGSTSSTVLPPSNPGHPTLPSPGQIFFVDLAPRARGASLLPVRGGL